MVIKLNKITENHSDKCDNTLIDTTYNSNINKFNDKSECHNHYQYKCKNNHNNHHNDSDYNNSPISTHKSIGTIKNQVINTSQQNNNNNIINVDEEKEEKQILIEKNKFQKQVNETLDKFSQRMNYQFNSIEKEGDEIINEIVKTQSIFSNNYHAYINTNNNKRVSSCQVLASPIFKIYKEYNINKNNIVFPMKVFYFCFHKIANTNNDIIHCGINDIIIKIGYKH